MRIKKTALQKITSIFTCVLLLVNSFTPYLLIVPTFNQVEAQEEAVIPTSEAAPTEIIDPTATPESTLAPTETVAPTQTVEATPTIKITPVETITPTEIPTLTPTEAPSVPSPPSTTATSSEVVTPTPTESPILLSKEGMVETTVIELYSCRADSLNGCLVTDKADYTPTEAAVITGHGFLTNTIYTIKISSTDELAVNFEKEITTDEEGSFTYSYQLDGTYRPNYLVELKDGSNQIVASVTFTDSLTTVSATLNGGSSVTVYPGTSITIAVTATLDNTSVWHRTARKISNSFGSFSSGECIDTLNHDSPGTYTESVTIDAPSLSGTYNVYIRTAGGSNCNSAVNNADLVLTGVVEVIDDVTAPTCPAPTISEGTHPGEQYATGNTIYYTTMVSGSGNFDVTVNATDPSGIQKVVFPDTVSNGSNDTSSPYTKTYSWASGDTFNSSSIITCYDDSSAHNQATTMLNVYRDNTLPVVNSITLDKYFVKNGADIIITSNVTETGSGISSCHAYWSTDTGIAGAGDTDLGDLGTDCSGTVTVPTSTGTRYIIIGGTLGLGDNVGLFATNGLASSAITMDNTSPSTSDDTGFGGQTFFESKTVTLTATDTGGSGIANTKYCVADSPAVCTPNITYTTPIVVTCPGVASCTKWLFYQSTDNADNVETSGMHSYNFNITNDLTPPTTTDSGIDGNWHSNDVTVTLACSDTGGSICGNTYYTIDGTEPDTNSTIGNSFTLSTDGEYTIKYFSEDNSGNTEAVKTAANQVKIDKSNPGDTGTPTSDVSSKTNQTLINWSWSAATDAISGIKNYIWNLWKGIVNKDSGTTTSTSKTLTISYGDGDYTFDVQTEDNAGNRSNVITSTTTTVDTVPPVITVLGDNPVTVEINSLYSDAGATAIDNIDGDVTSNLIFNATNVDTSQVGSYTVYFDANDSSGNGAVQQTRTVNVIDSVADAFAIISVNLAAPGSDIANNLNTVNTNNVGSFSGLYFEKSIGGTPVGKLTFTGSLDLSDNATQTFLQNLGSVLDQSNGRIAFDAGTSAEFAAHGATLEMYDMPPGILESQLIVRDEADNILDPTGIVGAFSQVGSTISFTAAHFTQFDIDTTPPTIDTVRDIAEEATSASGAVATFTVPMSHDNIDPDVISDCDAISGSTFPLGVTTVTCSKTDTAGNAGTNTFTITVEDTTPPTITLLGDNPQTVELGSTYTDPKATFYDAVDGTLTIRGNSRNKVNTNVVGTYSFNYTAGDDAGNNATPVTRTVYVVDTTPPQLTSAYTRDLDENGKIDTVELTLNETIDHSKLAPSGNDGWAVDGYTVSKVDTGNGDNDTTLLIQLDEGLNSDTGNRPSISYTKQLIPESTHDMAGNQLESVTGYGTDDGAKPVLLSAETKDVDANGKIDLFKLIFSEHINDLKLNKGNADGWDIVGYGGEAIDTGSVDDDNILLLAITEGSTYDVDTTPTIKYTNTNDLYSTHDKVDNQLATLEKTTIDTAAPTTPTANPVGDDYKADQSVILTGETGAKIRYTTDGTIPTDSIGTLYLSPILIGVDTVIKAIAIDSSGNVSSVMTETYGIAPLISGETSSSVTTTTATITWTTDDPSTSRVVYDTVSHSLGAGANYGYANSTVEDSTKVISHSVGLTGLTAGTTYYYRTISHGSPESVGDELSFATTSTSTTSDGGGTVTGTSTSSPSAPVCNDQKPGSAPTLLSAVAGFNSVTLTWSKATDPVSYYLMTFGTSPGSQTYGNPNIGNKDTTSYTVSGLSGGITYYFKVRAGNGCMPGDFSNEASAAPSGGFIEGVPAGFEAGVLGESTKSGELVGELRGEPTPTTTVINAGLVKGIESIAKNNFSKYILPIILIILLTAVIFYFYKRRNS